MASYEIPLFEDVFLKAEVYYQYIPNLPVPTNPDKYWSPVFGGIDPDDTLANIGTGKNYGIELTVKKNFSNNYYFLITSSLFESKFKAADGIWRDTRYNIHYINNFVGGKEFSWGNNKMVGLNGKIIWSGVNASPLLTLMLQLRKVKQFMIQISYIVLRPGIISGSI